MDPRKMTDNFEQSLTFNQKETKMAKNPPPGDGHRIGSIRKRSQTYNPVNDRWVKRDTDSGQFIDQKSNKAPFKGVRKEK
jgi:hypothetical protein